MKYAVYFLHIWRMKDGNLTMSEIRDMSYQRMKEWFEYHERIVGKEATVHCFFSDYDIQNEELKTMATYFMKGNYKEITVNVNTGQVTEKRGISKLHPR